MKNTRKTKNDVRNKVFIFLTICVVAVIMFYVWLYLTRPTAKNQNTMNSTSKQQVIDSDLQHGEKTRPSESNNLPADSTNRTSDSVPTNNALTVSISSFEQKNGVVSAYAKTSGSGTCVFLYQPADQGKPVSGQVSTADLACSLQIAESQFSYLGPWRLTVTYYANDGKAEVTQNVTIH